jgi:hypothetical protein
VVILQDDLLGEYELLQDKPAGDISTDHLAPPYLYNSFLPTIYELSNITGLRKYKTPLKKRARMGPPM